MPAGISISAAMGDLQCSVCAVQPELDDAGMRNQNILQSIGMRI